MNNKDYYADVVIVMGSRDLNFYHREYIYIGIINCIGVQTVKQAVLTSVTIVWHARYFYVDVLVNILNKKS